MIVATKYESEPSSWYKRYKSYPTYCSTPEQMETRNIPSIHYVGELKGTTLLQVTAIIRHGARTPASTDRKCWAGYWDSPETGVWDCDLTTMTAPPTERIVNEEEDGKIAAAEEVDRGQEAMFLFEKRYDALRNPPELSNELNGTCQLGQLILQGYEQEIANGVHLRHAYVYDGTNKEHHAAFDLRMRLFDFTRHDNKGVRAPRPYEEPFLYYRTDDDQRSLMSGQVLFRGLFGDDFANYSQTEDKDPIITAHTADFSRDILSANEEACPRLKHLRARAEASAAYRAFNSSWEAEMLRLVMEKELGASLDKNVVDCMMTTICTDRPLPDIVNDYDGENGNGIHVQNNDESDGGSRNRNRRALSESHDGNDVGYGTNIFERLVNFVQKQYSFHLRHNDAAYAKLAMGPLWAEIMTNIWPIAARTKEPDGSAPPKLAIFSAHGTTIVSLLASLGSDVWDGMNPPYASMLVIEIHRFVGGSPNTKQYKTDYAFRLLYNGKSITNKMKHCHADMCDLRILIDHVEPFATVWPDCFSGDEAFSVVQETEALLSTTEGVAVLAFVIASFSAMGSLTTFYCMTGRLPFCGKNAVQYGEGYYSNNTKIPNTHDDGVDVKKAAPVATGESENLNFQAQDNTFVVTTYD